MVTPKAMRSVYSTIVQHSLIRVRGNLLMEHMLTEITFKLLGNILLSRHTGCWTNAVCFYGH